MTQQVNLRLFRAEMAPGLRLYAARAQGEHATFAAWLRNIRSEVIRDGLDDGDGEANGSPLQKGRPNRAAERRQRTNLPDDRELSGHRAMKPCGFFRPRRRPPMASPPDGTNNMRYDLRTMAPQVVNLRSYARRLARLGTIFIVALAAGCASHHGGGSAGGQAAAGRGVYKVGAPYTIDGVTYTPQEEFNHVETGVASWYGPGFHGRNTANGEVYDQSDRTAAHRTLQMPCVVRVTNLDNGLSTTVRINDRGPYARSRILDVSRATAEQLGMMRTGTAHIRIEQLPAESMAVKEVALSGGGAAEQEAALARLAAGRGVPSPAAAVAQSPPPAQTGWPSDPTPLPPESQRPFGPGSGPTVASLANHPAAGFYVQTGAFSTMTNAERQRALIASYGTTEISPGSTAGREVFRVRVGPYTTSDAAGIVADRLKRSGYGDARVVAD